MVKNLYETNIGKTELFADGEILEKICGDAALKLHSPVLKEVAVTSEKPWEWLFGYPSVISDGKGGYFLYYRGMGTSRTYNKDECEKQVTCICHSSDGMNFSRMDTGFLWEGSKNNNIVYHGSICHNFTPFYDTNPKCLPSQRFKAVGGVYNQEKNEGLFALASEDGIHWELLSNVSIFTSGAFDSQNVAFYDHILGKYRMYSRYWHTGRSDKHEFGGFRAIQSCVSDDFLHWSEAVPNEYGEEISEHFYTNATIPCPGAEHLLLSFPNRFNETRKRIMTHDGYGISDTVFMTSHDGVNWERLFKESWLRPGMDEKNWTDRNMMIGAGIIETPDGNFSLICGEHNYTDDNRLRRVVIRRHGFVSLSAGWKTGCGITKPFIYEGGDLHLNYSTSAAGYVKAWLVCADAESPCSAPENTAELYGDTLDDAYSLNTADGFIGKKVRLCFELKDGDVYTYRFER